MYFDASGAPSASTIQDLITRGLEKIVSPLESIAIALAAVGTVSMALIQTVKNIFPVRRWFQRFRLQKWIEESAKRYGEVGDSLRSSRVQITSVIGKLAKRNDPERTPTQENRSSRRKSRGKPAAHTPAGSSKNQGQPSHAEVAGTETSNELDLFIPEAAKATVDLVALTTSGDEAALYDLPIEQLCDQIRNVVSVVLDYPDKHTDLLYCLAKGADRKDIDLVVKEATPKPPSQAVDPNSVTGKDAFRAFADAKTRLVIQVRCSVDAIQTSVGFRWKFWLQLGAVILSAGLGFAAFEIGHHLAEKSGQTSDGLSPIQVVGMSALVGLLAGFLAPVARDLVAAIEKWRS